MADHLPALGSLKIYLVLLSYAIGNVDSLAVDNVRIFLNAAVFVVVFRVHKATCCCHTLLMASTKFTFTSDRRIFLVNFIFIVSDIAGSGTRLCNCLSLDASPCALFAFIPL